MDSTQEEEKKKKKALEGGFALFKVLRHSVGDEEAIEESMIFILGVYGHISAESLGLEQERYNILRAELLTRFKALLDDPSTSLIP